MITDDKINYYEDAHGTIRRTQPKIHKSKKHRIKERWEGKEEQRFPSTGRGHIDTEALEKTKQCLRQHPEGVTAVQVAEAVGVSQARAARLLDLLSGGQDGESGQDFLIYVDDELGDPLYYISKDGGEK